MAGLLLTSAVLGPRKVNVIQPDAVATGMKRFSDAPASARAELVEAMHEASINMQPSAAEEAVRLEAEYAKRVVDTIILVSTSLGPEQDPELSNNDPDSIHAIGVGVVSQAAVSVVRRETEQRQIAHETRFGTAISDEGKERKRRTLKKSMTPGWTTFVDGPKAHLFRNDFPDASDRSVREIPQSDIAKSRTDRLELPNGFMDSIRVAEDLSAVAIVDAVVLEAVTEQIQVEQQAIYDAYTDLQTFRRQ